MTSLRSISLCYHVKLPGSPHGRDDPMQRHCFDTFRKVLFGHGYVRFHPVDKVCNESYSVLFRAACNEQFLENDTQRGSTGFGLCPSRVI